jgi:hypothetical protein
MPIRKIQQKNQKGGNKNENLQSSSCGVGRNDRIGLGRAGESGIDAG